MKLNSVNSLNILSRSYNCFLFCYNKCLMNLVAKTLIVFIIEGAIIVLYLFFFIDNISAIIVSKLIQVLLKVSYNLNLEKSMLDIF
jgi:hypothetical protein